MSIFRDDTISIQTQKTKGSSGPVQQASGSPLEPESGQPVQRQRGAREEMGVVCPS
jgi:hypothetical protein